MDTACVTETVETVSGPSLPAITPLRRRVNESDLLHRAKAEVTVTNSTPATISSAQWSAHRIRFLAEASEPAMVVVAQSYYPNWHAFVNHRPVQLWGANHAYQALQVPAGRHEIALVYEDKQFHRGAIISMLALAVCVFLLFRQDDPASEGWHRSLLKAPEGMKLEGEAVAENV